MLSKLLSPCRSQASRLLVARSVQPLSVRSSAILPPSQYDMAIPKRLKLRYALYHYWELIPLVTVTVFALIVIGCGSIYWACKHKVDVMFIPGKREEISRTMDLRNPTVHKLIIINQRYEPWPEMADVLDKMVAAERRAALHL